MHTNRHSHLLPALCCCCALVLLLAACGGAVSPSGTQSSSTGATNGGPRQTGGDSSTAQAADSQVLSPLPTSCPAPGTARSALMAPLTLQNHQNVIYTVNEFQGNTPTFGTLKRYEAVTGTKTEIIKIPGASITDAQVSADGQWIAFSSVAAGTQKLQLVRVDGKGLQTLYCGPTFDLQWSADAKLLAFTSYQNRASDIYLLNVRNGSLQRVFHPVRIINNGIGSYRLQSWLDATHLYVVTQPLDQPADTLSILDITRGTDQDTNALQPVLHLNPSTSAFCWNNDSSYDGKSLFVSECGFVDPRTGHGAIKGPTSITSEPAIGGSQRTIFSSPTLAITAIRSISNTTLLLLIQNSGSNADTSHNGLWKINTDGTGLKQLFFDGAGVSAGPDTLCQYTQYPWSNVSRDSSMFALQHNSGANQKTISLVISPLNGGSPTTFASISDGTQMAIVGWTTM